MFTLFRYGLLPVAFYCVVVFASGVHIIATNFAQKSSWPQTVATVMQSQDLGQVAAEFRGTENDFPDPYGTLQYVVNGETHTWQGRGRDIGLTAMTPGDKIKLYYNPENKQELNTLVLLGASTGSIILAVAFAFLAFYVWFFWLRGWLRRSGPDDYEGDASFPDRVPEWGSSQSEPLRSSLGAQRAAAINTRPTGRSFEQGRRASFGKR